MNHSFRAQRLGDGRKELRRNGEVVETTAPGSARSIALGELFAERVASEVARVVVGLGEPVEPGRETLFERTWESWLGRALSGNEQVPIEDDDSPAD